MKSPRFTLLPTTADSMPGMFLPFALAQATFAMNCFNGDDFSPSSRVELRMYIPHGRTGSIIALLLFAPLALQSGADSFGQRVQFSQAPCGSLRVWSLRRLDRYCEIRRLSRASHARPRAIERPAPARAPALARPSGGVPSPDLRFARS